MIFSAKGNSSGGKMQRVPKAEGSVHIPNSDQNPGRNIQSGNDFSTFPFASNQRFSLERYSAIVIPYQPGNHGQSIMNPQGKPATSPPLTTDFKTDHC
jgi:hypothetical protein